METAATTTPLVLPRRRWPWALAVLGGIAVAAVSVFLLTRGGDETHAVRGPAGNPFTVTQPSGWESLSPEQLQGLPRQPVAVLRETDGKGIVVINVNARTNANLSKLSGQLEARLSSKIPDFKLVKSHPVTVQAGRALSLSYARTKKGTATTLLVVPTSQGLYTLNAVVPAGQDDAARDAASILSSFDLTSAR
jgi:hypothetical protein